MPWIEWYNSLVKPSWTPAPGTIGMIWSILYPIIVVSFGFVFVQAFRKKLPWRVAMPFAINLVANLIFTPIQFGMRNLQLAAVDSGLQPQSHAFVPVPGLDLTSFVNDLIGRNPQMRAVALAQAVHRLAKSHASTGGNWRAVVDGLRPHTARLWQCLNVSERRRFLSRLRPYWEVHRHRMAPAIADRLSHWMQQEAVVTLFGQVIEAKSMTDGVWLTLRPRCGDAPVTNRFDWVVNCTGPAPSNSAEANPVIGSLLIQNWVRRDALSLGLDTDPMGRAVSAAGESVPDLFVVGTLRKPLLWESTAVPELRQQAAQVSHQILQLLPEDSSCL